VPPETEKISKTRSEDFEPSQAQLESAAKRAYSGQTRQACNEQIEQFLPMVHKIARKVATYLRPPLSYDDLISAGTVGLVKAARDYDPRYQAEFKTYAYIRIKGAIIDELRSWSFIPPNVHRQIQQATKVSMEIAGQTGSVPDDVELAEKLGVTIEKLNQTFDSARAKHFISMDTRSEPGPALGNILAAPEAAGPDKHLEHAELVQKLAKAISQLKERQRRIIVLYYQQHLTMKQIAGLFDITEPRVSQLHASALFNLSVKLRQWDDDEK